MRAFVLYRKKDHSGISGTGYVAQGVVFDDGRVAFRWLGEDATTIIADSIRQVERIHGHDGDTEVVYVPILVPWEGGW